MLVECKPRDQADCGIDRGEKIKILPLPNIYGNTLVLSQILMLISGHSTFFKDQFAT